MRIEIQRTIDGEAVEILVPETPEDVEELKKRDDLDDDFSFGDGLDLG